MAPGAKFGNVLEIVIKTEKQSSPTKVVVPTEPATVTSIEVHDDIRKVKRLECISNTLAVSRSGLLAGRKVGVGDQVGERIWLDDGGKGNVRVGLDDFDNG